MLNKNEMKSEIQITFIAGFDSVTGAALWIVIWKKIKKFVSISKNNLRTKFELEIWHFWSLQILSNLVTLKHLSAQYPRAKLC